MPNPQQQQPDADAHDFAREAGALAAAYLDSVTAQRRYEFRFHLWTPDETQQALNAAGQEGWQLHTFALGRDNHYHVVMFRHVPPQASEQEQS